MVGGAGNDSFFIAIGKDLGPAERDTIVGGAGGEDEVVITLNAAQTASAAFQAELGKLAAFMAGPDKGSDTVHFTSDLLHLDFTGIEKVRVRLDGVLKPIAQVVVAPIAAADLYATKEDTVLNVGSGQGLLANDVGGTGGAKLFVTAGLFATALGGSVVVANDGSFVYTPAANANPL
jgi:hypothetical protein